MISRISKKTLTPGHKLNGLVPQKRSDFRCYSLRNDSNVHLFSCKTSRFCKSYIPSSISVFNNLYCLLISQISFLLFSPYDLALQPFDLLTFALVFLQHLPPYYIMHFDILIKLSFIVSLQYSYTQNGYRILILDFDLYIP